LLCAWLCCGKIPEISDMCYTVNMDADHHIWHVWAQTLHRWGLDEFVTSILELSGPLTFFGAQTIYLIQPFVGWAIPENQLNGVAELLDNPLQTQAFVAYLREGKP